jgi:hypothetical protein
MDPNSTYHLVYNLAGLNEHVVVNRKKNYWGWGLPAKKVDKMCNVQSIDDVTTVIA